MNEKKYNFSVPEGYFEQLQARLSEIPAECQSRVVKVPFLSKVAPYVALAASFAMAFLVGSFFLGKTPDTSDITIEDYYAADLIPVTNPYAIYDEDFVYEGSQHSEEDIVQYLISSGASVDYIAYLLNE